MCFKNLELHDKNTLLLVLPCPWVDHLQERVNWSVFPEMGGLGHYMTHQMLPITLHEKQESKSILYPLLDPLPDWGMEAGVTISHSCAIDLGTSSLT